jgi:diguanylate cyclase (GGDEF)-like protein/PAS domain S-box-containing protein
VDDRVQTSAAPAVAADGGQSSPAVEAAAQRQRTRRWLVRLLSGLAVLTLVISSALIFAVLPQASRESQRALTRVAAIGDLETLVGTQPNDQRAYMLTRNAIFLAQFDERTTSAERAAASLEASANARERALLGAAMRDYRFFVAEHPEVVALVDAGDQEAAINVSFGAARTHRLAAEHRLHALHDIVATESKARLATNHRWAVGLTLGLLVLSVGPAVASFVLGRTLRRAADEAAAIADRERLAKAQRVAQLGSWEDDLTTGAVFWSDELFRILGYERDDVAPSLAAFVERVHPDDAPRVRDVVGGAIATGGGPFEFVNRIVRPGGEVRWLESQGEVVVGADGNAVSVVGTALDVTERQETMDQVRRARERLADQAAEMQHRAHHDALTELPNRALLHDRIEETLGDGTPAALLVLDLDGFKRVNDSLGHAIGDELLRLVGQRLTRSVRGAPRPRRGGAEPCPADLVARIGADEFAILLSDADEAAACLVAERVIAECGEPFRLGGRELRLSASVGVARTDWSSGPRDIVRDADVAMYQSKGAGGGRLTIFDPAMHAALVERFTLEAELRAAVDAGALTLYYQPIADPRTGVVDKVEALVRWQHPERGFLPPDSFIPLAEETGVIVPLGAWVLEEACRELVRLSESDVGASELRMAVNLSGRQLEDAGLVAMVAEVLARHALDPSRIVLEVTETVLMEHASYSLVALRELDALGVRLAIDDFGTGYSSLSRLRTLPVSELKIDKSFIDEVDVAGERAPVVAAIIALAHGLGHSVVAEGVEHAGQLASLARLGCDRVQGYLLSRPVPAAELRALLSSSSSGAGGAAAPFAPFAELVASSLSPSSVDDDRVASAMSVVERAVGTGGVVVDGGGGGDGLVQLLLAELSRLTGLESTYLTRIDYDADEQEIVAAHNSGDGPMRIDPDVRVPWEDTICRRALAGGPRATSDVHADYAESVAAAQLGMTGYAMAPVVDGGGSIVGTLCAATASGRSVDEGTVALLNVFSRLIGEALAQHDAA